MNNSIYKTTVFFNKRLSMGHLDTYLAKSLVGMHLKGPSQPHLCFFFTYENLAIIFYSEHVETKEITFKPLKTENQTYLQEPNLQKNNKILLHHAMQIISMASKMVEAD